MKWYGALGNHEYGYSVEAQLQLGETYPNWILPSRYYSKRLQLQGSQYLSMIFIDSSPCVSEYRSSDPAGWDPCSTECKHTQLSAGRRTQSWINQAPAWILKDCL